jgi:hypothetical protein
MKTRNRTTIAAVFTIAAILTLVTACRSNEQARDNKVQCGRNLKALRICITQYRDDHGGSFPPSLKEALTNVGVGNIKLLQCPSASQKSLSATDNSESLGYFYIDWSNRGVEQPPGNFPVIYDAQLQNHRNGINVVCIDGTLFWDGNANWLKTFAHKHPDANLPIPK